MTDMRRSRQPGRVRGAETRTGAPQRPVSVERRIEQLQDSVKVREQQNRTLVAQIKLLERSIADQDEAQAEIAALKAEIREVTRANREHAKRNEALQAEIARLKTASRKGARTERDATLP
jgi:predicted RNase H-like nuclease (RuvC/YqgF family)